MASGRTNVGGGKYGLNSLIPFNSLSLFDKVNSGMFKSENIISAITSPFKIIFPRDTTYFYVVETTLSPVKVHKIDKATVALLATFTVAGVASASGAAANGTLYFVDATNTMSIVIRRYTNAGALSWQNTMALTGEFRMFSIQFNDASFIVVDHVLGATYPIIRKRACSNYADQGSVTMANMGEYTPIAVTNHFDDGSFILRQSSGSYLNQGMGHYNASGTLRKLLSSGSLANSYAYSTYDARLWCDGTNFVAHTAGPASKLGNAKYRCFSIADTTGTPIYEILAPIIEGEGNTLWKYIAGQFKEITPATGIVMATVAVDAIDTDTLKQNVIVYNKAATVYASTMLDAISNVAKITS